MDPELIFSKNPRPGIYYETEARSLLLQPRKGTLSLISCFDNGYDHIIWVWDYQNQRRYETFFDNDCVPQKINKLELTLINPGNSFFYQDRLYFCYKDKKGYLRTKELAAYTTWFQALTWGEACEIRNAKCHIARVFHITDDKFQALKPLGYCWRVFNHETILSAPLFLDDYKQMSMSDVRNLTYEKLEPGEIILHNSERWVVYCCQENQFFINKSPLQLKITNHIINQKNSL